MDSDVPSNFMKSLGRMTQQDLRTLYNIFTTDPWPDHASTQTAKADLVKQRIHLHLMGQANNYTAVVKYVTKDTEQECEDMPRKTFFFKSSSGF